MKLIAHRGLINGPDKEKENHPSTILDVRNLGYDCEIDLWYINKEMYLGHDGPQYKIDNNFLNMPGLWIHCKNLESLEYCMETGKLNYFWHDKDSYTLTSRKYIWAYPGQPLNKWSVCVMPEWSDPEFKNLNLNCYGICSDFIHKINMLIPNGQI